MNENNLSICPPTLTEKVSEFKDFPKVPTGFNQRQPGEWNLSNTVLGCGLLNFQGWSSGIGIGNNADLESKLFVWSYYSANQSKYPHDKWGARSLDGSLEAPISVSRMRYQFLNARFGMVFASHLDWVERLEKFVKEHNLGAISHTHSFKNQQYKMNDDAVGLWNWNGNHPSLERFPSIKVVK